MRCVLLILLAFGVLAPGNLAAAPAKPTKSDARRYAECMTQARAKPASGLANARGWAAKKGGPPARHCEAVALLGLGRHGEAARLLENIARTATDARTRRLRADIFGQAGNAWLIAKKPFLAKEAIDRALALRPNDPELLLDRGIAYASLKQYQGAVDDTTQILARSPRRLDALILRATAYRHLKRLDLALKDIDAALARKPIPPAALLEQGYILSLKGDREGARSAWNVLTKIAPGTAAANEARQQLPVLMKK